MRGGPGGAPTAVLAPITPGSEYGPGQDFRYAEIVLPAVVAPQPYDLAEGSAVVRAAPGREEEARQNWSDRVAALHVKQSVDQLEAFSTGLSTEQGDGTMRYDDQIAYIPTDHELSVLRDEIAPKILSGKDLKAKFPAFTDDSADSFYFVPDEYVAKYEEGLDGTPKVTMLPEGDRAKTSPEHIRLERGFVDRVRSLTTPLTGAETDALAALIQEGRPISDGLTEVLREKFAPGMDLDSETLGRMLQESGKLPELLAMPSVDHGAEAPRRRTWPWHRRRQPTPSAEAPPPAGPTEVIDLSATAMIHPRYSAGVVVASPVSPREEDDGYGEHEDQSHRSLLFHIRQSFVDAARPVTSRIAPYMRRRRGATPTGQAEQTGQEQRHIDLDAMYERGWTHDPSRTMAILLGRIPTPEDTGPNAESQRDLSTAVTARLAEVERRFLDTYRPSLEGLDHTGMSPEQYPDITRNPDEKQAWSEWIRQELFKDETLPDGERIDVAAAIREVFREGTGWPEEFGDPAEAGMAALVEAVVAERFKAMSRQEIDAARQRAGLEPFSPQGQASRAGLDRTSLVPLVRT